MWPGRQFVSMGTIRTIRMRVRLTGITVRVGFPAECLSVQARGIAVGDIPTMAVTMVVHFMVADTTTAVLTGISTDTGVPRVVVMDAASKDVVLVGAARPRGSTAKADSTVEVDTVAGSTEDGADGLSIGFSRRLVA